MTLRSYSCRMKEIVYGGGDDEIEYDAVGNRDALTMVPWDARISEIIIGRQTYTATRNGSPLRTTDDPGIELRDRRDGTVHARITPAASPSAEILERDIGARAELQWVIGTPDLVTANIDLELTIVAEEKARTLGGIIRGLQSANYWPARGVIRASTSELSAMRVGSETDAFTLGSTRIEGLTIEAGQRYLVLTSDTHVGSGLYTFRANAVPLREPDYDTGLVRGSMVGTGADSDGNPEHIFLCANSGTATFNVTPILYDLIEDKMDFLLRRGQAESVVLFQATSPINEPNNNSVAEIALAEDGRNFSVIWIYGNYHGGNTEARKREHRIFSSRWEGRSQGFEMKVDNGNIQSNTSGGNFSRVDLILGYR